MSARRTLPRSHPLRAVLAALGGTALALAGPAFGRLGPWSPPVAVAIDDACGFVNQPIAYGDSYSMLEDGPDLHVAQYGFLANDVCWYPTTAISPFSGSGGSWQIGNGDFIFSPYSDFFGAAAMHYTFTGPLGESNPATITVNVASVNDAPAIGGGCSVIQVFEDSGAYPAGCTFSATAGGGIFEMSQQMTGHASTNHPELFSSGPALPGSQVLAAFTGNVAFTPAANANGSATILAWVTDSGGTANGGVDASSKVPITVTIIPVDDPPNAVNDSYATAFGHALAIPAGSGVLHNDSDIDGPALSASKVSGPSHGVVSLQSDGSFTYTPTAGFSGKDTFDYKTTSGSLSDNATATITVAAPGATVPPTTPPAAASSVAGPSPTAAASPAAGESLAASLAPEISAPVASPSASPVASPAPVVTTGGGSDFTPWLILLVVVIVLVVGGNVAYAQYLRSRRAGPPDDPTAHTGP